MANSVCEVLVTEKRLNRPIGNFDPESGAVVDFFGVVRQLENAREIEGIEYEAHLAMAENQLQHISEAAVEKFSLRKAIVHHRIGYVRAGEPSLMIRVAAERRDAALDASKWIIDELKKKVPIWKQPRFKKEDQRTGSLIGTVSTQ